MADCPGLPGTVPVLIGKVLGRVGPDHLGLGQLGIHAKITILWFKELMIGSETSPLIWER